MNLSAKVKVEIVGTNESITLVLDRKHYQYDGVSSDLASQGELFEIVNHAELGLFKVSVQSQIVGHGESYRDVQFLPIQLDKKQSRILKNLKVCEIKFVRYV